MRRMCLFFTLAACSEEKLLSATVLEARGTVTADGEEIGPGDEVFSGDEIVIPSDGRLELDVHEVGRVRIFSSTKLELEREPKRITIRLLTGSVWAIVNKLTAGGQLDIEGETAVAGVRGTELVVETTDDGDEVRVLKGEVDVAAKNDRDKPKRVRAGERSKVKRHKAPSEPERYDSNADRAKWSDLKDAGREIKEGFKKGGRAVRDNGRKVGRKIRDFFR